MVKVFRVPIHELPNGGITDEQSSFAFRIRSCWVTVSILARLQLTTGQIRASGAGEDWIMQICLRCCAALSLPREPCVRILVRPPSSLLATFPSVPCSPPSRGVFVLLANNLTVSWEIGHSKSSAWLRLGEIHFPIPSPPLPGVIRIGLPALK